MTDNEKKAFEKSLQVIFNKENDYERFYAIWEAALSYERDNNKRSDMEEEVANLKNKLSEAETVILGIRDAVDIVSDHYLQVEEHAGVVGVSLDRESARRVKSFLEAHCLFDKYVFTNKK